MHPFVHRREARALTDQPDETEPPSLAEVIEFPARPALPWRLRDMRVEIEWHFREARHGRT